MSILRCVGALTWMSLAALGCTSGSGGSVGDGSGGGSSSTTAAGTDELDPACACVETEEDGAFPSAPLCGALLCPVVVVTCEGSESAADLAACRGDSATLVVADPEALTCALEALRDRSEGFVRWVSNEPESSVDYGYISIDAGGRGIGRTWSIDDLDSAVSDAVLGELDATASFEACLGAEDERTRFFCLVDALDVELAICDAGWGEDLAL